MNPDMHLIHESLRSLHSAIANAFLYGMGHTQVTRLAEASFNCISNALDLSPEISMVVVEGELIINGEPPLSSFYLNRFAETLTSGGINHLKFTSGLTYEEITTLIGELADQSCRKNFLSSEHLRLGQVDLSLEDESDDSNGSRNISFEELSAEELARFTEIYDLLKKRSKFKISSLAEIVSAFIETFHQEGETRIVMAAMRNSDEWVFTHSANVCILNLTQSIELGIEGKALHDIGLASMLHDIGKLTLPEELLTTDGLLTESEFDLMQEHPANGARLLLETPGMPRLAVAVAYEHHMRYNFSGYPQAPEGWRLNLCSHMTMISDFFDAMRTRRTYRNPMDLKAIAGMMLQRAGTEFHPLLTRNFLNILKRVITASRSSSHTSS